MKNRHAWPSVILQFSFGLKSHYMVADLRHPPLRTFVFILSWPLGTRHHFRPTLTPTAAVISPIFLFESEFIFITFAATMARTTPRFPGWWKPWSTHPALGLDACWETQYRKCGEKLLHSYKMLLLFFSLHFLYMHYEHWTFNS